MRIPSYLIRNRFGIFYFRVVFPPLVCAILNRKETRKSLRTTDRKIAVQMSLEFQKVNRRLFKEILQTKMKWIEAKKLFDKVAEELFQKYVKRVENEGFNFHDPDSLFSIIPEAGTFLSPNPTIYQGKAIHIDRHTGQEIYADEFEAHYHRQPEVVQFVENIISEHELTIEQGSEEYRKFCLQALEMLYGLDKRKLQYREQVLYGGQPLVVTAPVANGNDTANDLPKITIRKLIDQYCHTKQFIDKVWTNPDTIKDKKQFLARIAEMFDYVANKKNPSVASLTREHAREIRHILRLIPSNLKKKYPTLTLKQVIKKSKDGDIPESALLKPNSINTFAGHINGLFKYALQEGYIKENYFTNLRAKKETKQVREAFTNEELRKFFNTDLYGKKEFPVRWSWRYWVPVIMLYTGARVEEICQLYLEDIYDEQGVLCFHIREKRGPETNQKITSVKNIQSNRFVPVHPKLKKVGLLRYVEHLKTSGKERLFPTLKNIDSKGNYKKCNPPASKWFNENDKKNHKKSYIAKCGIEDESKVLYCFRHTVETLLINHKQDLEHDKIDALLGHQPKSTGRLHYGSYDPATLFRIVKMIDYPNAKLPWDVNKEYGKVSFPW